MDGRVTSAFTRVFDALCPAMTTSLALHRLRRGDELIERLAPAVAEAHAIVRIAILLVLVHGKRSVFRSFSLRLHHDDRGEGRDIEAGIGRPVAGLKRYGPDELAVGPRSRGSSRRSLSLGLPGSASPCGRCCRGEGRFRNRPFSTAPA